MSIAEWIAAIATELQLRLIPYKTSGRSNSIVSARAAEPEQRAGRTRFFTTTSRQRGSSAFEGSP